MGKRDNGGSAFPIPGSEQGHIPNGTWNQTYEPPTEGMSLMDWFAGKAMQVVLEIRGEDKLSDIEHELRAGGNEAKIAYQIAEAMIAEKRRRGDE